MGSTQVAEWPVSQLVGVSEREGKRERVDNLGIFCGAVLGIYAN